MKLPFFYFYKGFIKSLGMSFPISDFQCALLRRLNVTPSQLHANSWAMVRTFEVLCPFFNIRPSVFYVLFLDEIIREGWLDIPKQRVREDI